MTREARILNCMKLLEMINNKDVSASMSGIEYFDDVLVEAKRRRQEGMPKLYQGNLSTRGRLL